MRGGGVWEQFASVPDCVFTGANRWCVQEGLRAAGRCGVKKSSFVDFFFFFVIKATRNMFPGLGLKYGTPLASSFSFFFFFYGRDSTRWCCNWWCFFYFFLIMQMWFWHKGLVLGLEESGKPELEHLLWVLPFIQAALGFKRTSFAVLRSRWCCTRLSDISRRSRLCFWLKPWNHRHGSFYHIGGKKMAFLAIIAPPAIPAFIHYFNDESLSRAGSLPTGFLFFVINCDMALASVSCKQQPAAMTLNSWILCE